MTEIQLKKPFDPNAGISEKTKRLELSDFHVSNPRRYVWVIVPNYGQGQRGDPHIFDNERDAVFFLKGAILGHLGGVDSNSIRKYELNKGFKE